LGFKILTNMKTLLSITLLSLFAFTTSACNKIKPSKKITTEERTIGKYEKLSVYDAFDVSVTYGSATSKITVEANDNLMKYIITELDGDHLVIKLDSKISVKSSATLKINITVPKLTEIKASGASSVEFLNELNTNNLTLDLSGASSLTGNLNLSSCDFDLSGASQIEVTGAITTAKATLSGASSLSGYGCVIESLTVDLSGASNASLTVNNTINVKASGASNLNYKGNATINSLDISGASNVNKK